MSMGIASDKAIERLEATHLPFHAARAELLSDWRQETPPLSLIMAAYARAICSHVDGLSPEQRRQLFSLVEELLEHGDDEVSTAIATCFLEGLQNASDRFDFRQVAPFLGPLSRSHCVAMDRFHGICTRGLDEGPGE
jgi:hypothetical protein